jgi:glycosyltransferase involved in cell wall biosynthesis
MMSLFIAQLPIDLASAKDSNPTEVRMDGGALYPSQFVTALVKYSRAQMIYFPQTPLRRWADIRSTDTFLTNADRIRFFPLSALSSLSHETDLILLSTGWHLEDLLMSRSALRGQPRPACALTHSLCSPSLLNTLLLLRMSPAREYDALVCSSRAGKQALDTMFNMISERCELAGTRLPDWKLAIPIIPLGVDVEEGQQARMADKDTCNLLYFGRLATNSKGDLRPVLVAFSTLLQEGLRAHLIIAGDDTQSNLTPLLTEFARALRCKEHVTIFPNPTSIDKEKLFGLADIFISPSISIQEQFGIALIEAMKAGLAVVASNWSGHRDIVVHGETGFLADTLFPAVADEPAEIVGPMRSDSLAEATSIDLGQMVSYLRLLISDPPLRKRFGAAAKQRVWTLYNWKHVIGMYDDLWDELRAKAARPNASQRNDGVQFERWTPQRLFGGFATRSWKCDTRVMASNLPTGMKEIICQSLADESATNASLAGLLDQLQKRGECMVEDLGMQLGDSLQDVVHSLGILAKHGLIVVAN